MSPQRLTSLSNLSGVVPPMITPFREDDGIDTMLLAQEARYLQAAGVGGMVVGGSMGEGSGMSPADLAEATRIVLEATKGELPVLSGIIADSSAEAIRLGRAAREAGAVGLQVPPPNPSYSMDTRILSDYYKALGDGVGLPLIIYNVIPWAQAALESLQEIVAGNPAVCGVKQSGRNIHTLTSLAASMRSTIRIFSAIDDMIYPSLLLGIHGTISGTSSIFPRETVAMYLAVERQDYEAALSIHKRISPIWRTIDYPDFACRAKYAIRLIGRDSGNVRRPFRELAPSAMRSIENALYANGFIDQGVPAFETLSQ